MLHECVYTCMYTCICTHTLYMYMYIPVCTVPCTHKSWTGSQSSKQQCKIAKSKISNQHCGRDCQSKPLERRRTSERVQVQVQECKCKKLREAAAAKTVPKSWYKQQKIDKLICKVTCNAQPSLIHARMCATPSGFVHTHGSTQGRIPTPPALNVVEQPGVFFREMVQQKDLFRRHDQCSQVHQTKTCTAQNASWIVDDGQGKIQPDNEWIDGITARLKTTMFDDSKGGFAVQDSSLSHCI